MRKGALVLIPFPFTDLSRQKVRPALVLVPGRGDDCIVAFVLSVSQTKRQLFSVAVEPSAANGLKVRSAIKIDKIATLEKKTVLGELGTLERKTLRLVDTKLKTLFEL